MSDNKSLKILLLEDNPGDVELIKFELDESNLDYELKHVYTKPDFLRELDEYVPDIILADYTIPNFSGMEAITLVKELTPEIPLVIVTGTIDEETAVNCMKAGAVDYVLKSSLKRISSAIKSGFEKRRLNKEKKKIEEELIFSLNILENISEAAIVINTKGETNYWNKTAELMFGYQKEEILNKKIMIFESDEYTQHFLSKISSLVDRKQYESDEVFYDKEQNKFWGLVKSSALYNKNGIMIGFLLTINNINERKIKEDKLSQYKDRTEEIFSSFPDIIVKINKDMTILDLRMPAHLEFLKPSESIIGKSLNDMNKEYSFISRDLISQFNYYILLTFKTGYIQTFETKFMLFGNLYNFEIRFSVINDNDVIAIIRDITTKEIVKEKELNDYITGTIRHSVDGKILSVSSEILEILGFDSEKEITDNYNIKDIYLNIDTYERSLSAMIINEIVSNVETKFKNKNKSEIDVNLNSRMIKDKVKNNVAFEIIVKYKKKSDSSEKQIKYFQYIETMSSLVTDTAYELNNISSALSMNTYILKNEIDIENNRAVSDNIKDMEKSINQIPDISNRLLNFNQLIKSTD